MDLSAKLADDVGMIYLIHYFSVPQPLEVVQAVKEMAATRDILVMEDITQALFSKDGERMGFGDYIVASTRKWFPMTDGGLLAIKDGTCGKLQTLEPAYDESVYQELLISVVRMQYEMNPQMDKAPYLRFEKAANASRYQGSDAPPHDGGIADDSLQHGFGRSDEETDRELPLSL